MAQALAGVAIAMAAFGAITQGIAQSNQEKSAANVADYNATIDRQQGQQALQISASREAQQRRAGTMALGDQAAAFGESGTAGGASAQDVMRQSAANAELDALNIRYEGQLQKRSYSQQALLDEYTARVHRSNANQALWGGVLGAGTAALSGSAQYASGTGMFASSRP